MSNYGDSIRFEEGDLVPDVFNVLDSFCESSLIPTRLDSFAVFSVFEDAAAGCEDSTMTGSVSKHSVKRESLRIVDSFREFCAEVGNRHLKRCDLFGQPI